MTDTDVQEPTTALAVSYTDLEEVLYGDSELAETDPTEGARQIVRRVMEAKTAEEVLGETEVIHARDFLDQSFVVVGIHWNRSTITGGAPIYAVMDAVDDDGTPFIVTCGGIRVMAQLARLAELQAFPARVRVLEAERETEAGHKPLRLVAG